MKSTKVYSKGLKELRLKLGIKPSPPQAEIETRVAELKQRVEWVVQKSKKRSEIVSHRTRGPQYRWTPEEDQKLMKLRASGLEWTSISKELHRSPRAVANRFLRLLARRSWP
jgi:Myb-like DNA-binding domain